jgi:hypothetical protein
MVVDAGRRAHQLMRALEHQQRAAGGRAARQRALQPQPRHVAGGQQAPLDLVELDVPAADERGHAVGDQDPHPIRHIVDLDLFDEAVDDNDPQGAMIVQLLRRHRDPYEDIAGTRIGLFQRIGELIDLGDGDTVPLDGLGERARLALELGKSPVDHEAPDDEAQTRRPGRSLQPRTARQLQATRRARCRRSQSLRRHLARRYRL